MRNALILLVFGFLLTSCGPVQVYYKANATVSRLNTDQTNCEVQALKDAPVANQIRQAPPRYVPGRRYCRSDGRCYNEGGFWVDGGVYSVDVNRDLRSRVMAQCMASKGYQPIELPRCSGSVMAAPLTGDTRLPQITGASCVVPYQNGLYQIVNSGPQ